MASLRDVGSEIRDPNHGGEEQAFIQWHPYALARLDAAGVVDYDARSNTIRYRGPGLALLEERFDRPWLVFT